MITKDNICKLKEILEKINNSNEVTLADFSEQVENPEELFKILLLVNKTKIKPLISNKNLQLKGKITLSTYDKQTALKIINETSTSDMITNYTLSQLKALYTAVYDGRKPRSKITKESLIKDLKLLIKNQLRAKDFSDL